jgi:hypothetical protein
VSSIKQSVINNWRILSIYIGSFIVFFGIYVYRLSALTGQKASILEQNSVLHGGSWHAIYDDPLNSPYFITVRLLRYMHGGLLTVRLASIMWCLLAIFIFFLIVKRLHGLFIASLGTILFATSAWVLHIGRFAGPDVLLLSAGLGLLLLFLRRKPAADAKTATRTSPLWFLVALIIGALYVPGVIWLVILAAILRPDVIKSAWVRASVLHRILSVLLGLILFAPFVRAAISSPKTFLSNWVGIQPHTPNIGHILHQFITVPDNLFLHGPNAPYIWLGRLPVIEVTTALFALVGIYYYARRFKQVSILLLIPFLCWLVIAMGDAQLLTIIVAFIYVFAAGGISYILRKWQKVFPRNPIARGLALAVILGIVALVTIYNIRLYFVAWAYNDATKAAYQQKL